MSFDNIYENIDNLFDAYVKKHNLIQTPFISEMADGTYLSTKNVLKDDGQDKLWLNHDLILFLKQTLLLTPEVARNIKETLITIGSFFKPHVDMIHQSKSPYHIMRIQKGISVRGERYIILLFQQTDMLIHLSSSKDGLQLIKFKEIDDIIETIPVNVVNHDINKALNKSVENFKNNMMFLAGNQVSHFDKKFVDELENSSLEDIVNIRLKAHHNITAFRIRDKLNIVHDLNKEKEKYPNFEFGVRSNTLTFFENDIMFFMNTMKTMLSTPIYDNFLQAVNFYHNYKQLMNQKYKLQFTFNVKHKLQEFGTLLQVSFGNDFELTFGVITESNDIYERPTLFKLFTRKKSNGSEQDFFYTDDFNGFYEYIFNLYSGNLTKILNKSVDQMSLDDGIVLMMANI